MESGKSYFQSSLLWAALILILVSIGLYWNSIENRNEVNQELVEEFQAASEQKAHFVSEKLDQVKESLNDSEVIWRNKPLRQAAREFQSENCVLLIYQKDELVFWTDNHDNLSSRTSEFPLNDNFIFLGNTWYINQNEKVGDYTLVGLIKVKTEFAYQNEFLVNHFHPGFPQVADRFYPVDYELKGASIYDLDGEYLFSLVANQKIQHTAMFGNVLLASSLLFLLLIYSLAVGIFYRTKRFPRAFGLLVSAMILFRLAGIFLGLPAAMYKLELFSPYPFAWSSLLPSLGDYMLSAISIFLISLFYIRYSSSSKQVSLTKEILSALLIGLYLVFIHFLLAGLIKHSSSVLDTERISEIELPTIATYLIAASLLGSFLLLCGHLIRRHLFRSNSKGKIFLFTAPLAPLISLLLQQFSLGGLIWLIVLVWLIYFIHRNSNELNYSGRIIYLLLLVAGLVLLIYPKGQAKKAEIQSLMALNLSSERDLLAERSLTALSESLLIDSVFRELILSSNESYDRVANYLKSERLNNYLSTYHFRLFVCTSGDSIESPQDGASTTCFNFFDQMIDKQGIAVAGDQFYFINDLDGSITYMGRFVLYQDQFKYQIYLVFDEKWMVNALGYPELLIENKHQNLVENYHFSYAKYYNGSLINQSGEYQYSLSPNKYLDGEPEGDWVHSEVNAYNHLVYRASDKNIIIVSYKTETAYDIIILISYLFFLLHLLFTAGSFLLNLGFRKKFWQFNFKNRIQLTMISILIVTMILIGAFTIYFNINQFDKKHNEILSEKIRSVQVELEHKLAAESEIRPEMYDYLTQLLIKFSNVFYSDINLYSLKGDLLVSSREEIFDKKLSGYKMHPDAYRYMAIRKSPLYIQNETIGELSYLSAYVPFRNSSNEILVYLNLPYFTRESSIRSETSGLINAVVNIYLLLIIITVIITLILTNRLTRPLLLIQDKLGKLNLQGKNEKIDYEHQDEIGELIGKFNQMVDELSRSAELLARNERESAWREMARQIAHEIKNPLTPMRLQVQHLLKMMERKQDGFEDQVKKVADILITQIDSLNTIAGEFSNFASLAEVNQKVVSLRKELETVTQLFSNEDERIRIEVKVEENKPYELESNDEQIRRMLINLIKNAIQAIPEGKEGKIRVVLGEFEGKIRLSISDNGKGVSADAKEKLFEPYFTTKSSGTGLGLAIVKGIVESAGGTIHYQSKAGLGSTFILDFPTLIKSS